MSAMNRFAQAMGDALVENSNQIETRFNELRDLSNKNFEVLQGEIASMNDKFTFLLESMAALEKKLEQCCSSSNQCGVTIDHPECCSVSGEPEEPEEPEVPEEPEEPEVQIIKVVEAPHKEVIVKTEPEPEEVSVDLQEEETENNAPAEEEEEEEELALVEKMLKSHDGPGKKKYYVTEDEEREIYEILEDGEPGDEPIGKLKPHGKTFRAYYFKKNEKK